MPILRADPPSHVARIALDAGTARRLADALAEHFEQAAVARFENHGRWHVEMHFPAAPDQAAIRRLVRAIAGAATARALKFETIAARDWAAASLAGLPPVAAGRFLVHGAHDRAKARHRLGIEIEATLAFGTGRHGSTRGCLIALDAILKSRRPRSILDVGTGSGVLAIAAAKTARGRVLASDIDQRAVRVAKANARSNRVAGAIEVLLARGVIAHRLRQRAPFDLVLANLLLEPIKFLAAPTASLLAPRALVIVSGLLPGQANAALAAFRPQKLALRRRIVLDGWATLVLARA